MQRTLHIMQCVHRPHIDLKTLLSPAYAHVGAWNSCFHCFFILCFVKMIYILYYIIICKQEDNCDDSTEMKMSFYYKSGVVVG